VRPFRDTRLRCIEGLDRPVSRRWPARRRTALPDP